LSVEPVLTTGAGGDERCGGTRCGKGGWDAAASAPPLDDWLRDLGCGCSLSLFEGSRKLG
jgi:hypothetical protein